MSVRYNGSSVYGKSDADFFSVSAMNHIGDADTIVYSMDGNVNKDFVRRIVNFGNYTDIDGNVESGIWYQSEYAIVACPYDVSEAFWYCKTALPAGTYSVAFGEDYGVQKAGTVFHFTLTKQVPAGGQLVCAQSNNVYSWQCDDATKGNMTNWAVYSYNSASTTSPLEKVSVASGLSGTLLGVFERDTPYNDSKLNDVERCSNGYGRWSQSALRQWLNGTGLANTWWTPQNVFDRPPQELASRRGFLYNVPSEIREKMKTVKVITGVDSGTSEYGETQDITYDKVFLPSLEEIFAQSDFPNVEGNVYPYWKKVIGGDKPSVTYLADAKRIAYDIRNTETQKRTYVLRSPSNTLASMPWCVNTNGEVVRTPAQSFAFVKPVWVE